MIVQLSLLSAIAQPLLASIVAAADHSSLAVRGVPPRALSIPAAPRLVRRTRSTSPLPYRPDASMPSNWAAPRPVGDLTAMEQRRFPGYQPSGATIAQQTNERERYWDKAGRWRRENAALHAQYVGGKPMSWWARERNARHKRMHRAVEDRGRRAAEYRDPVHKHREDPLLWQ